MALSAEDRRNASHMMARLMDAQGPVTLTKPDILAAVAGVDDYLDDNAAAMNQAIPQPARAALSPSQKAALFSYVAKRRFGG